MRLASVHTRGESGLDAPEVSVEVHLGGGLPGLAIVGLAETAVKESRERVKAAIAQCGFDFPQRRITVNLAPADLPKSGGRFDLPIAVGILAASGQVPVEPLPGWEFLGELSLSGSVRPVVGLLPAMLAIRRGGRAGVIPRGCTAEAGLLRNVDLRIAADLPEVVRHLQGEAPLPRAAFAAQLTAPESGEDLSDIEGQAHAKRALEIAAAGGHNAVLVGPPGTGKSMLARRLPGLLPLLTEDETLESAALASLAGVRTNDWAQRRPFRAPHHTASSVALVGGGRQPRPGEISLAHHGVLFLDELPEFARPVLEALREPLETGRIVVARAVRSVEFPARFQLIGAMNPCPCGFFGDLARDCKCSPDQIRCYQGRLSGPFLDRIDIRVAVTRSEIRLSQREPAEPSAAVAARVARARWLQAGRCGVLNSQLGVVAIRAHCMPDLSGVRLLESAATRLQLSRRACDGVLRVARTIADLAQTDTVGSAHVAEALSLRSAFPG